MKSPCKKGSAWDSWQRAGERVKGQPYDKIVDAAIYFALEWAQPRTPAYDARYRAFMEGALS